jgi:hypothetical protein
MERCCHSSQGEFRRNTPKQGTSDTLFSSGDDGGDALANPALGTGTKGQGASATSSSSHRHTRDQTQFHNILCHLSNFGKVPRLSSTDRDMANLRDLTTSP